MENKKFGVIYSMTPEALEKIKKVPTSFTFVKFLTHESIPRFSDDAKLLLYKSHSEKKIIGEGIIKSSELLTEDEILKQHLSSLLISENKLREYVGGRKHKKLLVLSIKNFKCFDDPIISKFNITMAGKILSKKEYESLFRE